MVRLIPLILPASTLLLVLSVMLNPIGINHTKVYADEPLVVNTITDPKMTLDLGTTSLQKLDTNTDTINYLSTTINVDVASIDGYDIYIQAAEGSSATLKNGNTEITGIQNNTFTDNTWGYAIADRETNGGKVENMTYRALPENGTALTSAYTSSANTEQKTFDLAFGAKFAANATPGSYKTNVLVSLAASTTETVTQESFIGVTDPTTGTKYTYMQDVNKTICDHLPAGAEFQLRDKRDDKIYWAAKLADGLCWMTQNLDLNLTEEGLTKDLSDINYDWTHSSSNVVPPENSLTQSTLSQWSGSSNDNIRSYDPGPSLGAVGSKYMPESALTNEWLTMEEVNGNDTWIPTYDKSFIDATSYNSSDGKMICTKKTNSMLGDMTSTYLPCRIYYYQYLLVTNHYNLHGLQGNYYSFNAITAGDGKNYTTKGQTVPNSICPKNWKLPTSGNNNTGSFGGLGLKTSEYGQSPYYFIASAYITNNGVLANNGTYRSHYWSASVYSVNNIYSLSYQFGSSPTLNVSYTDGRRIEGYTARCVMR